MGFMRKARDRPMSRLLWLAAAAVLLALPAAAQAEGWVKYGFEGVLVGINLPCSAPTPIVLTANWASTTPSTLTSTWCPAVDEEEPEPEELEWGGSRVVLLSDFSEDGRLPTTSRGPALLATVSSHRHKARYTIFFQFTANGAYVESGHVLLKSTYWPATRIWQGEDAFVNYCIDKHHEITSINHRLGCYEPPLRSVTAKVVWAHPH